MWPNWATFLGSLKRTQMLLQCHPIWPLFRQRSVSEICCQIFQRSEAFFCTMCRTVQCFLMWQQFFIELNFRNCRNQQCATLHNPNEMAAPRLEVEADWGFADLRVNWLKYDLELFYLWFSSSGCIQVHHESAILLERGWITLNCHIFESMPLIWSPFSNLHLHLWFCVIAGKLKPPFILPDFVFK